MAILPKDNSGSGDRGTPSISIILPIPYIADSALSHVWQVQSPGFFGDIPQAVRSRIAIHRSVGQFADSA
jgi:hypothetical protein